MPVRLWVVDEWPYVTKAQSDPLCFVPGVLRRHRLREVVKWDLITRVIVPAVCMLALCVITLRAQTADQVLVVVNKQSRDSREIGQYYITKRGVPLANLCTIDTAPEESIAREVYDNEIRKPVGGFLEEAQSGREDSLHRHHRRRPTEDLRRR